MIDIQEYEYKSPNYSVEVQIMLLHLCQKWYLILYPGQHETAMLASAVLSSRNISTPTPPPPYPRTTTQIVHCAIRCSHPRDLRVWDRGPAGELLSTR